MRRYREKVWVEPTVCGNPVKDGSRLEQQRARPGEEPDEQRALPDLGNADMSGFSSAGWQAPWEGKINNKWGT